MKKVITPVGASLFSNYMDEHDDITSYYEMFEKAPLDKWESYAPHIEAVKDAVLPWAEENEKASAEIKSLTKILEREKGDLEVCLIATETVVSRLAAEILKNILDGIRNKHGNRLTIHFNPDQDIIAGLQVENQHYFEKKGIVGLINRLFDIISGYPDNVLLNITGGYKATIPYLTIMGQINNIPLCYIFEETEGLITIPQAPIDINWELFNQYWKDFALLYDKDVVEYSKLDYHFKADCLSCLETVDNLISLNSLGKMLWETYRFKYFLFYCPDDVWNEIQQQSHICEILQNKFFDLKKRDNKTEIKNGHVVYDDGNNPYRIYYFKEDSKIYVYKTFEDHRASDSFIRQSFDKENIKNNSCVRKLEVIHV
ncbi:MAG: putative CRISPR-associated protein [Desulfobacteraceae bacterium]|nr:putative CRISPR-associated protein [Desulfobacteraceae bacterium]